MSTICRLSLWRGCGTMLPVQTATQCSIVTRGTQVASCQWGPSVCTAGRSERPAGPLAPHETGLGCCWCYIMTCAQRVPTVQP